MSLKWPNWYILMRVYETWIMSFIGKCWDADVIVASLDSWINWKWAILRVGHLNFGCFISGPFWQWGVSLASNPSDLVLDVSDTQQFRPLVKGSIETTHFWHVYVDIHNTSFISKGICQDSLDHGYPNKRGLSGVSTKSHCSGVNLSKGTVVIQLRVITSWSLPLSSPFEVYK